MNSRYTALTILTCFLLGLTPGCKRSKPPAGPDTDPQPPAVVAPAPQPPKPTTPPGATPEDGEWQGAVEGAHIRFVVAKNGTVIQDIKGGIELTSGSSRSGTPFNIPGPVPVEKGRFTAKFDRGAIEGRFETPTAASGSTSAKFGFVDADFTKPGGVGGKTDYSGAVAWKAARRKPLTDKDKELILGKWRDPKGDVLEFLPDGKLKITTKEGGWYYSPDTSRFKVEFGTGIQQRSGKYTVDSDTIIVDLEGSALGPSKWEMVSVTADTLSYDAGSKRELKRVNK